jgi:hypothetical protein
MKRDGPKAPTADHVPLGTTYHPDEKANVIADYLENQLSLHDLCDENHERHMETTVRVVLASVGGIPLGKVRPCDVYNIANN